MDSGMDLKEAVPNLGFEAVPKSQLDLISWRQVEPAAEEPAQLVKTKTTGNLRAQSLHVETPDEVASMVASLRKLPQEEMWYWPQTTITTWSKPSGLAREP
jgi:hypothetical protein